MYSDESEYSDSDLNINLSDPVEEHDVPEEEFTVAETYSDYMPAKLKFGEKHPDPVVETASLSSVPPPDILYKLSIPESTIKSGKLSALQLESITYASQAHEQMLPDGSRAGFLIGDGAGVGKGRTIAGIIWENFLKGRKRSIWISVSNDLKYDAERDLRDIGVDHIPVHQLNKLKYAQINSYQNGNISHGVIFSTYSALISETGSSSSCFNSRLDQLLEWCGDNFDGAIIFDECHRAKNLCPDKGTKGTKTGFKVLELQKRLPLARVVYASATGASEPRNMAYMTRLGLWGKSTPFSKFDEFLQAIERRGVGAKEIVAMDMKLRGMYIARQLSFQGATFNVHEVPITKEFETVYNASVDLWVEAMHKFQEASKLLMEEDRSSKLTWRQFWASHQRFFKYLCIATKVDRAVAIAKEAVANDKCVVIGLQFTGEARTLDELDKNDGELTDFVSTAKGVIKTLVENHFPTLENIKKKMAVINNRKRKTEFNPGTSKRKRDDDDEVGYLPGMFDGPNDDSDSDNDINNFFPKAFGRPSTSRKRNRKTTRRKPSTKPSNKINKPVRKNYTSRFTKRLTPTKKSIDHTTALRTELLEKIEELGEKLPTNTLDELIDKLGGPGYVAEMTGRKGRVVHTYKNCVQYETRADSDIPLEMINLAEKQRFMDGEKLIAIISEAASSGISLQSDRKVANQRRRVHITLELPWSADKAIQQFGRTHRSNQVNAPEYIFLISDLAGEKRFASIVAKRLESLGALTHGDRRATQTTDLSQFNIDNKYGRKALEVVMKAVIGEPVTNVPLVPLPDDYEGKFFKHVAKALANVGLVEYDELIDDYTLPKNFAFIPRFLNRILGIPVRLQNRLFRYFVDTLDTIVKQAKSLGRFDHGIVDFGTGNQNVYLDRTQKFHRKHATGIAPIELYVVKVVSGMSWTEAMSICNELSGEHEGFWLSYQVRCNKRIATLAKLIPTTNKIAHTQMYCVYRPYSGSVIRHEALDTLERTNRKVEPAEAESVWTAEYESSLNTCWHAFWDGNCKAVTLGVDCEVGRRKKTYAIVSGSVLSIWGRLESLTVNRSGQKSGNMQVVRLKTVEDKKIVGVLIAKDTVDELIQILSKESVEH